MQDALKRSENSKEKQKNSYEEKLAEKDTIIRELKKEVAHLAAVAAHDGTNTGIPTSATPINKNKLGSTEKPEKVLEFIKFNPNCLKSDF